MQKWEIWLCLFGIGVGLMAAFGPTAFPDVWTIIWTIGFWVGAAMVIIAIIGAFCDNFQLSKRSSLIIDYKEGEQSYQQWDPGNSDRQYMLHRIRIFNDDLNQVNQISARLKSITPEPISWKIRGVPCDLHVMGRDVHLTLNEPKFDLEGKADKFIDVIYLGRRGYNANEFIRPAVKWPQAQSIFIAEDKGYKLVISIFANGEKYCEKSFKLKKVSDKNYELRHRFSEL